MSDSLTLSLPINGTQDSVVSLKVDMDKCVLTRLGIYFPKGHVGLTQVYIEYLSRRVIPAKGINTYRGDDIYFNLRPDLVLNRAPYFLVFRGWNEDTKYEHSVYFDWDVDYADNRVSGGSSAISRLFSAFGGT